MHLIKDLIYISDNGMIIDVESGKVNSTIYDKYGRTKHNVIEPYCIKECIIPMINDTTLILYNFITGDELLNINRAQHQTVSLDSKVAININYITVKDNIIRIGSCERSHGHTTISNNHVYIIKSDADVPLEDQCVICFKRTNKSHLLVPCGHTQYCEKCINKISDCSICRATIKQVIKIQK
jgi:hypothetical protein